MRNYIYLMGFRRKGSPSKTRYIKARETNFRRARAAVLSMLKKNKSYIIGEVAVATIDPVTGYEMSLKTVYHKEVKR